MPQWILTYEGVDVTLDVSSMVLSLTYDDEVGGASSSLDVEVEDSRQRWQGPWYPQLGDRLGLQIGYSGESLLPCGVFQVDEIELAGPPDMMHLRCLEAWITPSLRTPMTAGYERQTLMQIVATVAARHGLSVTGAAGDPNLVFDRVTQKQESDLAFLSRLAAEYSFDFTARGNQLVFFERTALEQAPPVIALQRSDLERFTFTNHARRTYKAAQVSWQNTVTKSLITRTAYATDTPPTGDTLKIVSRSENAQQASARANAVLHHHNMLAATATVSLPGVPLLVAGNNASLTGWGESDGTYHVMKARHRLASDRGYTTEAELRRLS